MAAVPKTVEPQGSVGSNPTPASTCTHCGKIVAKNTQFCKNKCRAEYNYLRYIERWKLGLEHGGRAEGAALSYYVRRYILERANNACEKCGFDILHPTDGKPIIEVDHVDGDSANSIEANLQALCPNCHALTPNYRRRNKSGEARRKYRAKRGYGKVTPV